VPDIDVNQLASEEREYRLATKAIDAIHSVAAAAIQAIDGHSKSPAVAFQLMNEQKGQDGK
jgi:hypothetical protein